MIALSVGAFAQQRSIQKSSDSYGYQNQKQERREVGRENNKKDYKYGYNTSSFDYRGLQLSSYQERKLDDLMFKMESDIRVAQRSNRNASSQIRKIEKSYDLQISKLLTKYQYDKFLRKYAYQYAGFGYGRV